MFTPVLTSSKFVDDGVLTPDEFVAAGDALIRVSPLWQWKSGEEGSRQSFLPSEKQYLQLRGVPSSQRASALESDFRRGTTEETTDEDGWVSAETGAKDTGVDLGSAAAPLSSAGVAAAGDDDDDGFDDLDGNDESTVAAALPPDAGTSGAADVADDDDEFLDLDSFGGEGLGADEATAVPEELAVAAAASGSASGAAAASCSDDFERGRSYDISIVYDRKYRVPRMFLFGYDEDSKPLSPKAVMEDVVSDYANKTVTVEPHFHEPSLPVQASIHPCRHSAAMKRIVASLIESGLSREEVAGRVELYLIYFLKFVQSVIPTIEYDSTVDVDVRRS